MTDIERADEYPAARAARFRIEADARGIPAVEVEACIRTARPALYLAEGGTGPVVAVTGGQLPEGAPAPSEMVFVAAIDCATLPVASTDLPLPTEGHLLFFADIEPDCAEVFADAVRYIPAGTPLSAELPDDLDADTIRRVRLNFHCHQWSWPWHAYRVHSDTDEESLQIVELLHAWSLGTQRWRFQLGGHPFIYNDDPVEAAREEEPLPVADDDEWVLLATWDSREDIEELIEGLFHWVIRRADLAALRFDRVFVFVDLC